MRACLLLGCLCCAGPIWAASPTTTSSRSIWDEDGSPASRLPDFSYAGYALSEKPIPSVPVATNAKDFGARGDGKTDDSQAIIAAINATRSGAVLLPAGRYVISAPLVIDRSGIVIRGEGPDKTVLVIPKSLEAIEGARSVDGVKSAYSFSGGFVQLKSGGGGKKLADISGPANRGDRELRLKAVVNLKPGDWVRLVMNNDAELSRSILGGQTPGVQTPTDLKHDVDWAVRLAGAQGDRLVLDRPLRVDVRPEWGAEIDSFEPTVQHSGVENLGFEFAGVPKRPHLKEEGFNAIWLNGVANCWVRSVTCTDADNGIIVNKSRFCTIEHVTLREAKRERPTGHHAFWATGYSQDCLFDNFVLDTEFVHDLSVEGFANGNVFTRGKGIAINMDHHRNSPYENLFTDLDIGNPRRLWDSSGRQDRGPHAGRYETFWSLRWASKSPPKLPDWPLMNLVNVPGYDDHRDLNGTWIEVAGESVPHNLYEAQRTKRLHAMGQK